MPEQLFDCKRDGLTIRGHAFGYRGDRQPAVILCHGFLADEQTCYKYAECLARLGFVAVTFDFCGGGVSCKSDGLSTDMTVFTEKADLMSVIREVSRRYEVSSLSLLGCSQGGLVAALAAAELGERVISGLMLLYPAVCIPDHARSGKMIYYSFDPQNIPDCLGVYPMKLGGDYARTVIHMDPYTELAGYGGPVLLLHGTEDRIVSIDYARRLREIYPECSYLELEGAGHIFRDGYDERAVKAIEEFARGLPGGGLPAVSERGITSNTGRK